MTRRAFQLLGLLERVLDRDHELRFSPTFLVAPPRSGSTLVRQIVAWGLPTCYLTNLVAGSRYVVGHPLAAAGALVVRWLYGSPPLGRRYGADPFHNRYGQIPGISAPAEAELVWDGWFGVRYGPVEPRDLSEARIRTIYRAVAATERIFGLPFVNKTSTLSLRIRALARIFPRAIFLQVLRDPVDTAQSLFRARRTEYPEWLGARPSECDPVEGKPLHRQVCEQVHFIEKSIARARRTLGEERFLSVNYRDVCRRPGRELARIADFMTRSGAPVHRIRTLPSCFPFSHGRKVRKPDYELIRRCLDDLGGWVHPIGQKHRLAAGG